MRTVAGGKVVANAQLVSHGKPPPTLQLQLTPLGPIYQLLLFDDLDAVREYGTLPESAMQVLSAGPGGSLSTGSENLMSRGRPARSASQCPPIFPRYDYFGVVRVRGPTRQLEVYDRVDRMPDPS